MDISLAKAIPWIFPWQRLSHGYSIDRLSGDFRAKKRAKISKICKVKGAFYKVKGY
jgi:hypothetical protein